MNEIIIDIKDDVFRDLNSNNLIIVKYNKNKTISIKETCIDYVSRLNNTKIKLILKGVDNGGK